MPANQPQPPRTPAARGPGSRLALDGNGPRLLLEGCHGRIRSLALQALRLTLRENAPTAEQLSGTASSLRHYFGETLPQHMADEEATLGPRLHGWMEKAAVRELVHQDRALDRVLRRLLPLWEFLSQHPHSLRTLAPVLAPPTAELAAVTTSHLTLEETELFPLLERLSPAETAAVWSEMRDRRLAVRSNPA